MIKKSLFVALLCHAFVTTSAAPAAESEWRVGRARINITPAEPVRLSGYASRNNPSQGVACELFAKALVFQDRSGDRGLLITVDLIGIRKSLTEQVTQRIEQRTGIPPDRVILNASHTHTGPALAGDVSELNFPAAQSEATVRYTRNLLDQLVEVAERANSELQPVTLSHGIGVAEFVMNRREPTDDGVILGFNPRGHIDRSVPVLEVADAAGKPIAILFGTACHNTTLTGNDMLVSGDFAGYAQHELERLRPGALAMFMQGCAGDANPHPRGNEAIARQHGKTLANEVLRVLAEERAPVHGPLRIAAGPVPLPLQSKLTRPDIERLASGRGGWRAFVANQMTTALERDGTLPDHYHAPTAVWQFGDDLTLIALSGEVVVDYVTRIADRIGDPQRLWIAAYCNDVYGYLPSARVLAEGGYETRGLYSGGVGLFSSQAENVLVDHVEKLVQQVRAGKKHP